MLPCKNRAERTDCSKLKMVSHVKSIKFHANLFWGGTPPKTITWLSGKSPHFVREQPSTHSCLGIFQLAMFGIFGWVVPKTATNCHLSHKKTSYILSLTLVVKNSDPKIMVYEIIPDYNWVAYVIPYITLPQSEADFCSFASWTAKLHRSWTHMLRWFFFLARSSP